VLLEVPPPSLDETSCPANKFASQHRLSKPRDGLAQLNPQSQSFSRGYGPTLPTSRVHMLPSTRGVLPRRPDAVTSTARQDVTTEAFHGPSTTAGTPCWPVLFHSAGLLAHGIAYKVARGVREKRKLFPGTSKASLRQSSGLPHTHK